MFTDLGNWVAPSQRALWVPLCVSHEMHMRGYVTMINTCLDEVAASRAGLPGTMPGLQRFNVVQVSAGSSAGHRPEANAQYL